MKKLMIVLVSCVFTIGAVAQTGTGTGKTKDKQQNIPAKKGVENADQNQSGVYCMMHKDGKKKLVSGDDKEVNKDVTLRNGSRVKTDGTVIRKDGSHTNLDAGECINNEGTIKSAGKDKHKVYEKDKKRPYDEMDKRKPGDMDDENNK